MMYIQPFPETIIKYVLKKKEKNSESNQYMA